MKVISISTFKKNVKNYLNYVCYSKNAVIIDGGEDDKSVVVIPFREYNSLKETEYLLSTKTNRVRLSESIDQINK